MTRAGRLAGLGLVAALLVAGLIALGLWQLERRVWKHALIARVEARVGAAPVAAPGSAEWPAVTAASHEYRRIFAIGRYLADRDTRVRATTDLGSGYWVMSPLDTGAAGILMVNRGFVPQGAAPAAYAPPAGPVRITGLLRISEPGGGFLRSNDPAADHWYSRDVAGIAARRGLGRVAPYFIDAARTGEGLPVGGLTVIAFADNHLQYALTWFALAALVAGGYIVLMREDRKRGRP
ncbi:SURF1 family protein [Sphingomonas naphthae]|uniref:SURF1-like protein n=1 Tax=Sphingomonas naphthae TaxID=1813468 RepID=A0ABY7TIS5_9SPHN|nr:SURF1 family protein [Sphingomonas naphthae]WCT73113.1 SURF1 family protein [Sphingomonas naphthae]